MGELRYRIAKSVVFRPIRDELVTVEVESGRIFHFSITTKPLFDYLKEARTLSSLLEHATSYGAGEREYLTEFLGKMREWKLVNCAPDGETEGDTRFPPPPYVRPRFLREAEKGLDEVAYLYP